MASFCGSNQKNKADWFDPLGPNAAGQHAPTGGPEQRTAIFNQLPGLGSRAQEAAGRSAQATETAASDPIWGQVKGMLGKTVSGQYLAPNPYLTNAMEASRKAADTRLRATREQTGADVEGQLAATRSGFARNGVSFGTGATQGQDNTRAAAAAALARGEQQAAADMNAQEQGALAENYGRERALQNQAAALAPTAASGQAQLLSSVPGQYLGPVKDVASVVQGLAGGGSVNDPTIVRKPGVMDYATQLIGSASSW